MIDQIVYLLIGPVVFEVAILGADPPVLWVTGRLQGERISQLDRAHGLGGILKTKISQMRKMVEKYIYRPNLLVHSVKNSPLYLKGNTQGRPRPEYTRHEVGVTGEMWRMVSTMVTNIGWCEDVAQRRPLPPPDNNIIIAAFLCLLLQSRVRS